MPLFLHDGGEAAEINGFSFLRSSTQIINREKMEASQESPRGTCTSVVVRFLLERLNV